MQFATINGVKFQDSDIINSMSYDPSEDEQEFWVLHDRGFVLGVVISDYPSFSMDDAIDTMVDEGKLDRYMIQPEEYKDYGVGAEEPNCVFLGNAGEPFDIEGLSIEEGICPVLSFVALLNKEN